MLVRANVWLVVFFGLVFLLLLSSSIHAATLSSSVQVSYPAASVAGSPVYADRPNAQSRSGANPPAASPSGPVVESLLVGHVTWQGRPPPPHPLDQLPITLTLQLGGTSVTYANQTTDAQGVFTVTVTTLPNGIYTWWAKGPFHLATTGTVPLMGDPITSLELGLQLTGDINNDNLVDITDVSNLRASFGLACGDATYNPNADFNGDCVVDSTDFSLLRRNFGLAGPPPPVPPTATPTPTSTPFGTPTNTPSPTRTLSPTRTATATPYWTPPPVQVCSVFPPDNIWNRNIQLVPVHELSAKFITVISPSMVLHPDFGSRLVNGLPNGFPYITVPGDQPRVPITFTYASESDPGPYPIPTNAPVEGGSGSTGDRHMLIIDQSSCDLYETHSTYPNPDGSWRAASGAIWPLNSNLLRPNTWTSADAAGLPIYAGLVRYDEVATGVITHALRFSTPNVRNTWVWPARHTDGPLTDEAAPPMGTRFRLKAAYDISPYPAQIQVILQALKTYGMFLADTDPGGTQLGLSGTPDPRWDDDVLRLLHNTHASDFEAVDESGLIVDPNSGQSH